MRNRSVFLALLGTTVVAGLSSRHFADSIPRFLAEHAGDALWTLAAYLVLAILFPAARWRRVAAGALGISFLVEFSQLLDWPWLAALRDYPLGRLVLGNGFIPVDLVRYAAGTVLGISIDLALSRAKDTSDRPASREPRA